MKGSMADEIRKFGNVVTGVDYEPRPGGYVVALDAGGAIAVVSTPRGFFLPGGGQEAGESPEDAAIRETREECGLRIRLGGRICTADEFVLGAEDGRNYRKCCVFFLAEVVARVGDAAEADHQLVWMSPEEAMTRLSPEIQRWAVEEATRTLPRPGE